MLKQVSEVSSKNTKNEILAAYQDLLEHVSDTKQETHQEIEKLHEEERLVTKASSYTIDHIITNLAQVKLSISQNLDQLEQKLLAEHRQFLELQTAIKIEKENIEKIHQIKINVDSLAALLLAQKEYKRSFDLEIEQKRKDYDHEVAQKRNLWRKEQEDYELEQKEVEARLKKERIREHEEYKYTLELERRRDSDLYAAKKESLEKEITEKRVEFQKEFAQREELLSSQEQKIESLRARVAQFPEELELAIENKEKSVTEGLENKYRYQTDLATKEIEGEKKLNQQIISSLREKIKEQEEQIKTLIQKVTDMGNQVQAMALKALESSGLRSFEEGKKAS